MKKSVKVTKTTEGIRKALFDEWEAFLAGEVDVEHAKTVSSLSNTIIKTVATDLKAAELMRKMNEGRDQPKTLADLNLNLMLSVEQIGEENE